MKKQGWGSWRLVMMMFMVVCLTAGCQALTAEQKEGLDQLNDDLMELKKKAAVYERRLSDIVPLVEEAKEAHEEGRLPAAELAAIIADVTENRETDLALLAETKADIRSVSDNVAALREQDVPVWRIVIPFLTAIAGIASGYVPAARRASLRTLERDAVIAGVEKHGTTETKLAIREASSLLGVAGSLHAAVKANGR